MKTIHFVGIFGSGMSALAQYMAASGHRVTGSDRQGDSPIRAKLEGLGATVFPQDGSGVGADTDVVCVSTAIEATNPDIAAALTYGIPIQHRSEILAELVAAKRSVVVAGTSGKSTTTAMIFELLSACGLAPSLVSGADLRTLGTNYHVGAGEWLVVEGDESDGSLVQYFPDVCVVLNLSKDHKPEAEVLAMFETLVSQSGWSLKNKDDAKLETLKTDATFGFEGIEILASDAFSSGVVVEGVPISIKAPGLHNASNLLAAIGVCRHLGCSLEALQLAATSFLGVDRRFVVHRTASGVTVVDDFAHNPEKIRAAVSAARGLGQRITALFQPHGYGPTRFLRSEYVRIFREIFGPGDVLILLPIYYAGGTAVKDISSADLVADLGAVPFSAYAPVSREEALSLLAAKSGDVVLVMGARDPSLPTFVHEVVQSF